MIDGAYTLHTEEVTKEQIRLVILEQYPNINKVILKLLLAIMPN